MELTIEQNCPSCGASIVLQEDDRLIKCMYCDVNNYRLESIAGRYLLPARIPAHIRESQIFYMPYLRFKGSVFYVHGAEVKYKIVDTSRIGIETESIPVSLGLRPQAMRLSAVVSSVNGEFIRQSVPTKSVFENAVKVVDLFSDRSKEKIYHRAFVGETLSRIYQPFYIHEGVIFDAVDNRAVGNERLFAEHMVKTCSSQVSWEPQFISTLCPECGGLLSGQRDSIVLHCQNCQSLWQENDKKFRSLDWLVVESADPAARYLPFWRTTFSVTGWNLKSFGDYLRFTNQPFVFGDKFDCTPLSFMIPAFKINPKAFLQAASQLTVSQWKLPKGRKHRVVGDHPVNLSQKEAAQAIKSILAVTTSNKKDRLPLLAEMSIGNAFSRLVYLPFIPHSHDLVQEHTLTTILVAALRYGRSL